MQMEQQDRREARQLKAIWHAMHRAQPKKPEAPVVAQPKQKGLKRMWVWEGEAVPSKQIMKGMQMTTEEIRAAGFKLPVISKKVKDAKGD